MIIELRSFVESPRQKKHLRHRSVLKAWRGVFLKSYIFALVAGAFCKRSQN